MPASIAACRTVFPFWTVRGRPSMVSETVSVTVLLLADGKELRVGETVSAVDRLLGKDADADPASPERGAHGERVTRFYERAGTRFVLVFEPFERNAEPRVAAIYLR